MNCFKESRRSLKIFLIYICELIILPICKLFTTFNTKNKTAHPNVEYSLYLNLNTSSYLRHMTKDCIQFMIGNSKCTFKWIQFLMHLVSLGTTKACGVYKFGSSISLNLGECLYFLLLDTLRYHIREKTCINVCNECCYSPSCCSKTLY